MVQEFASRPQGSPQVRFAALRQRNFVFFWVGLLISHTGVWVQSVGQGWLVYQLTNTPVWLGLTSLAFALPMLVLPLVGGAVADRIDRVNLIRTAQLIMAAAALALAGLTTAGAVTAWHLVSFSMLQGVVLAFEGPARHALVPDLVDRERLVSAVSLFQSSYQLGGFFGPALAGLVLAVLGAGRIDALFGLNGLTFLINAAALSLLRGLPHQREAGTPLLGTMTEGIRFVWQRQGLRALLGLIALVGIFGRSYIALMPVFARDILRTDARGLGYLTAAPGLGVVLGAILLSAGTADWQRGRAIVISAVAFSATLAVFALSRLLPLSAVLLIVLGATMVAFVSTTSATMQLAVPGPLRGRVMSLWAIANVGLPSVGTMATASAAALIGAPLAVASGAVLVLVTTAVLSRTIYRAASQ